MRTTGKAPREFRNQMREDSFYVPEFNRCMPQPNEMYHDEFIPAPVKIQEERKSLMLTYNHYVGISKKLEVDVESGAMLGMTSMTAGTSSMLEQKLVNGYDGYGGVHDNLVFNPAGGLNFYTLNNKLVIEETQTRK